MNSAAVATANICRTDAFAGPGGVGVGGGGPDPMQQGEHRLLHLPQVQQRLLPAAAGYR